MTYISHYSSSLGGITLASNGSQITGLWFDGQRHFGSTLTGACEERSLLIFEEAHRWLDTYFGGKDPGFLPTLKVEGTAFEHAVWDILLMIPFGQTMTYGGIAKQLACQRGIPRMSARAVGGAVGRNPISLMIPCHRVLGANGSLTGYAGGVERKRLLLLLEGRQNAINSANCPFTKEGKSDTMSSGVLGTVCADA